MMAMNVFLMTVSILNVALGVLNLLVYARANPRCRLSINLYAGLWCTGYGLISVIEILYRGWL